LTEQLKPRKDLAISITYCGSQRHFGQAGPALWKWYYNHYNHKPYRSFNWQDTSTDLLQL